jgi:uncharacterized heparinase superfamily protein
VRLIFFKVRGIRARGIGLELGFYRLVLRETGKALTALPARILLRLRVALSRAPQKLLIAPYDLRTSDPAMASDIYAGYYVFSGKAISTGGRSPFAIEGAPQGWIDTLYGFGWLRHLRAADSPLARSHARALFHEFLNLPLSPQHPSMRPKVRARRLMAFLAQSPLLLQGADHDFYQRFLKILRCLVVMAEHDSRHAPCPNERFQALIALCYASLCIDGGEPLLRRIVPRLSHALETHIQPDGGPYDRNPHTLIEHLLDLLPLRQTFQSRHIEPPPELLRAIERMMPTLRLLRHGEGSLALFNGMSRTAVDHVATVLMYDESRGETRKSAPMTGYERIEAGGTVLIADTGAAPSLRHSAWAHAGALSFELSSGNERILVNCGAPRGRDPDPSRIARMTGAHSTATFKNLPQSQPLRVEGWWGHRFLTRWLQSRLGIILFPSCIDVTCERQDEEQEISLQACVTFRTGSLASGEANPQHRRLWRMAADGTRLEGRDSFHAMPPSTDTAIRFHLHPGIRLVTAPDGEIVLLRLPNQELWRFLADTGEATLEGSVFLAATDGLRRSEQIVIRLDASRVTELNWAFEKVEPS